MAAVPRNGGGIAARQGAVERNKRGRFVGTENLTDKQEAFVAAYISNGCNGMVAAAAAGYAEPRVDSWRLLRNWAVQQAIHARREAEIMTEGADIAWGVLREVMTDKTAKPEVRVRAATWTLETAGHRALPGGAGPTAAQKPLSEMTIAELEAFVSGGADRLRALHEQQAKTIDAEPAVLIDARDDARDAPADPPAEPDDTA